jgi:hypothetical protein
MHDSWIGSLPIGSTAGRGKRREEEEKKRRREEEGAKKRRREEEEEAKKKREMSNGQSNGWSNRLCNTWDGSQVQSIFKQKRAGNRRGLKQCDAIRQIRGGSLLQPPEGGRGGGRGGTYCISKGTYPDAL